MNVLHDSVECNVDLDVMTVIVHCLDFSRILVVLNRTVTSDINLHMYLLSFKIFTCMQSAHHKNINYSMF